MRRVCIYGMGRNGILLYSQLREQKVIVDCFIDNDSSKEGIVFDGISCYTINDFVISGLDVNEKIIVSVKKNDHIVENLKKIGCDNVILWDEVDEYLHSTSKAISDNDVIMNIKKKIYDNHTRMELWKIFDEL